MNKDLKEMYKEQSRQKFEMREANRGFKYTIISSLITFILTTIVSLVIVRINIVENKKLAKETTLDTIKNNEKPYLSILDKENIYFINEEIESKNSSYYYYVYNCEPYNIKDNNDSFAYVSNKNIGIVLSNVGGGTANNVKLHCYNGSKNTKIMHSTSERSKGHLMERIGLESEEHILKGSDKVYSLDLKTMSNDYNRIYNTYVFIIEYKDVISNKYYDILYVEYESNFTSVDFKKPYNYSDNDYIELRLNYMNNGTSEYKNFLDKNKDIEKFVKGLE